uniref:Uncharacterized protein n=1 Tax=Octopus bimaculoides TaxID=37653 RepID=A0A0L8H5M6_OCTBM
MRIIDIIKMLSKQALPFRGHRNELAYTLDNEVLDHGNFLATMKFMAKYDPIMAAHVSAVQNKSGQRLKQQGKARSKGHDGHVTYLSKTIINLLIQIMKNMVLERIGHEVSQAIYYSIQVDSTQDNSSINQFSIIIWHVLKGVIYE